MSESSNRKPSNSHDTTLKPIASTKYSVLAVTSLSLSCLSIIIGPLGYIPGIIFGHAARLECKRNPQLMGSRMALAGLIIGYLGLALTIMVIVLIFHFVDFKLTTFKATDPDAFYRMLEELRRFLSTNRTV